MIFVEGSYVLGVIVVIWLDLRVLFFCDYDNFYGWILFVYVCRDSWLLCLLIVWDFFEIGLYIN